MLSGKDDDGCVLEGCVICKKPRLPALAYAAELPEFKAPTSVEPTDTSKRAVFDMVGYNLCLAGTERFCFSLGWLRKLDLLLLVLLDALKQRKPEVQKPLWSRCC